METIFLEHLPLNVRKVEKEPCVLALGFFDGVHLGHQKVLQTARKIAAEKNVPMAVMTFYPHPRQIFDKRNAPLKYLTPLHRKQRILQNMGVDKLYVVKFDSFFAKINPDQFVEWYLIQLGCVHVVTGFDYTYGYRGHGNNETLLKSGKGRFGVTVVNKISSSKEKISSTLIRGLVKEGNMELIPKYLGSFYKVDGYIVRSLLLKNGVQELLINIADDYLLPAKGEYQIQLNCNNLIYSGRIKNTLVKDDYALLNVHIYEDYNLSVGQPVEIMWLKTEPETNKDPFKTEKENVYVE